MPQTFESYLEEAKTFYSSRKYHNVVPTKEWFGKVENSHEEIRKIIGGDISTQDIQLEEETIPLDDWMAKNYYNNLCMYVPSLKDMKEVTWQDLRLPYINHKGRKFKTSRFLSKLFQNEYGAYNAKYQLDGLGQSWKNNSVQPIKLSVTLSTKAIDFARLGHYGPDSYSCFAQNNDNAVHKYILGQSKNTFVLYIKEGRKVVARCWGAADTEKALFACSNFYLEGTISKKSIQKAILEFFKKFVPDCKLFDNREKTHLSFSNGYIYSNGDAVVYGSKDGTVKMKEDVSLFRCDNCGLIHNNDNKDPENTAEQLGYKITKTRIYCGFCAPDFK